MPELVWRARRPTRSFKAVLSRMTKVKRGRPLAVNRTQTLILLPLTPSYKSARLGLPPDLGGFCSTQLDGAQMGSEDTRTFKQRPLLVPWRQLVGQMSSRRRWLQ